MRLIVGLGNPGAEYAWTPHNLGFLVVDRLAQLAANAPQPPMIERRLVDYLKGLKVHRYEVPRWRPEGKAFVRQVPLYGHQVLLAKPQTYMNASGMAVRDLAARFEFDPARMIVLVDDVALPWGSLRIRERGSAGGHNGLKSIIGALGSDEFIRIRLGIQPEHPVGDLGDYVLRPMRKAQLEEAAEMVASAADAVEAILTEGAGRAMSKFNRRVEPEEEV